MIVVDANVLVYYFVGVSAPLTEAAKVWRLNDAHWCAPDLWRSEFRNALANLLRVKAIDLAAALKYWGEAAASLAGGTHAPNAERVIGLAASSGCTAYDCEYVELAQRLGVPLLTADKKLVAAFPKLCRPLV